MDQSCFFKTRGELIGPGEALLNNGSFVEKRKLRSITEVLCGSSGVGCHFMSYFTSGPESVVFYMGSVACPLRNVVFCMGSYMLFHKGFPYRVRDFLMFVVWASAGFQRLDTHMGADLSENAR